MRILFISTTFPDATSPARGTYNSALCAALAQQHEVRVLAPRSFAEAVPFRMKGKAYQLPEHLSQIGIKAQYPTYWYTPKFQQEKCGDQMWWSVKKTIQQMTKDWTPDAVLSYWAHPEGDVGVRAGRMFEAPSAVIVGGSDVLILPQLPKRGPRVRDVLLESDAVITVSDGLKNSVQELGVHTGRVQTIYQGVERDKFHQNISRQEAQQKLGLDSTRAHLVWVGRIVPVKNLDVLISATRHLKQQDCSFQLHLIGDGPERSRLEQIVNQNSLQETVSFIGAIGHEEIPDWYRAANLTVMSSDSEGLPNVLRESLACGTPFVSTDVGSIKEIAQPEFSRLVPPQDPKALAEAISTSLNDEFISNAQQYVPRTWRDTASETVQLFERLIAGRKQANGDAFPVNTCSASENRSPQEIF